MSGSRNVPVDLPKNGVVGTCAHCHKQELIHCRGMSSKCYQLARRRGLLGPMTYRNEDGTLFCEWCDTPVGPRTRLCEQCCEAARFAAAPKAACGRCGKNRPLGKGSICASCRDVVRKAERRGCPPPQVVRDGRGGCPSFRARRVHTSPEGVAVSVQIRGVRNKLDAISAARKLTALAPELVRELLAEFSEE